MRAIDNMTPQEIDTLALKGMTAPRTSSERPAPNKAQHSPLPWEIIDRAERFIGSGDIGPYLCEVKNPSDAKLIVRAVNGYDKAIEACRLAQAVIAGADTSGSGQRAAHSALFLVLANHEGSEQ